MPVADGGEGPGTGVAGILDGAEEIFTIYRYPLYGYLRASAMGHEDAQDVLPSFFIKMLSNDSLGSADSQRGKLRSFLVSCLSNYKNNWRRSEQCRQNKIRPEADLSDADEARFKREQLATLETPENYYDRRWTAELVNRVRRRLAHQFEKRSRQDLYAALARLLSTETPENETLIEIATRLRLTGKALRVSLHRLRRDFRDLLIQEVQRTLAEGEDVKSEIQHLLGLFER